MLIDQMWLTKYLYNSILVRFDMCTLTIALFAGQEGEVRGDADADADARGAALDARERALAERERGYSSAVRRREGNRFGKLRHTLPDLIKSWQTFRQISSSLLST